MDTYSTAVGNTDSSNPAPSRETFALLESESELQRFVEAWKSGRLPKAEWTHGAHVAMAAYFAFDHAAEATFAIMKAGILHHNTSVGTPNTEDNGYHETLTRFWGRGNRRLYSDWPLPLATRGGAGSGRGVRKRPGPLPAVLQL